MMTFCVRHVKRKLVHSQKIMEKLICSVQTTFPKVSFKVADATLTAHGVHNVSVMLALSKAFFTSAVNTAYCSLLRSLANEMCIRTDAVSVVLAKTSPSITLPSKTLCG